MKLDTARHAFVTGGASGIGLAVAEALADRGIAVTIADLAADRLDKAVAARSGLRGIRLDVRDRAAWAAAREEAEAASGPVDILFNNAGIAAAGYELADMDPEMFDRVVGVSLGGVFNGVTTFAAAMRARGRGHIVNTASMAGITEPTNGVGGSYVAAKFGVVGLTETLRKEMAPHGVGVSVLCPGMVDTDITTNSAMLGGGLRMPENVDMAAIASAMAAFERGSPADTAKLVLRGIEDDIAYIISAGRGWWPLAQARHTALEAAFEGMR